MASVAEIKKRMQEGGFRAETSNSSSSVGSESSQRIKKIKDRMKNEGFSWDVTEDYINTFITDAKNFLKSAETDYEGITWGNASSTYDSRRETYSDLYKRADYINAWLRSNKDRLDPDTYNSFSETLKSISGGTRSVMDGFEEYKDYYSRWETEEDYNKAVEEQKEYEELKTFDVASAEKRIAEIDKELENTDSHIKKTAFESDNVIGDFFSEFFASYEENPKYNELSGEKTELETKINRAKRIQEAIALTEEALNATDFEEYAGVGEKKGLETHDAFSGTNGSSVVFGSDVNNRIIAFRNNRLDNGIPMASLYGVGSSGGGGIDKEAEKFARWMTDEEYQIYTYYYGKYGDEKAEEYLKSIEEQVNAREGEMLYNNVKDSIFLEYAFGVTAGLDQFASGVGNLFSDEDYISASSIQMASGMVREDLADTGFTLPEWMGGASIGQVGYDMVTTTSNMLPSILVSTIPVVGQVAGATLLGASAAGNAKAEMLRLGYSQEQATTYGLLVGASEGVLQYALGGISKLGGKVSGNAVSKFVSGIDNAFARTAIKVGGNMVSEGLEEALQSIIEPYFKSIATGEEFEGIDWSEVVYSGLLGMVTAGVLEGPSTIAGEISTYKAGKNIKADTDALNRLTKLGSTMSADSVAYKLAGKIDENTGAYTIGRLLNEVGASLSEANISDIVKSLERKGVTSQDAQTIAKWMSKVVEGKTFSKRQAAALESNDVLATTLVDVLLNNNSTVWQRMNGYEELRKLANSKASAKNPTADKTKATPVTENPTTEEIATEGEIEASEDVETKIVGKDIKVKDIVSINNGEVELLLDNGETVNARDVGFANEDEGLIYEAVANMDIDRARDMVQAFNASKNAPLATPQRADSFILGFNEAYGYGRYGIPEEVLERDGKYSKSLSGGQKKIAYNRGAIDAKSEVTAKQEAINEKVEKATATKKANNTETKGGRVSFERGAKATTRDEKRAVRLAKYLSTAIGIDIVFYDARTTSDPNGKGANGYFDEKTNSIHLDLQKSHDDTKTIAFTLSHETVHFIKKWSPEKFDTLARFLIEQYSEHGVYVSTMLANKMAELGTQDRDLAYEEMICDALETMLLDSNAMVKLMQLRQTDLGLFEKLKMHILELLNKLREAYRKLGYETTTDEAKALLKMTDVLEKLHSMFEDAAVDATQSFQAVQNSNETVFGEASIDMGKTESGVKHQLKTHKKIGENALAYNDRHKNVHKAILQVGVETMYEMAEAMLPYLEEEGILPPDIPGKTIFKNGSYGKTGENTTLCVRTLTYEDFKDRVAEKVGRPLTVSESLLVSQKIYDIATEPQCIYCYVAADRKAYDEYLGEYHKAMDKYIKALRNGGDSQALYTEYLAGRKDTNQQKKRWSMWESIAKSGKEYISAKDLTTKRKRDDIIAKKNAFSEQIKDAQRYAQSASWAKTVFDYRAYNGEILKMTSKFVDMLNSEYGLRMYSFSDYTPAFIVENMQMILDASVKGLKSLAYTKDTDYAEIFASTGQAINISCFAKWDAESGTYVEDNRQGANWEKTKNLRKQYRNVGAVMVATNDAMVEWALKQNWVDVVIPYHIVKTGTTIANEYQWNNYTSESSDKIGNKGANIYPTEHNNDFATYSNLLNERGITPRFSRWYDKVASGELTEEQYMKLVNEVRLPASELSPVIPSFNLDAAKKSFGIDNEGKVIEGGFVDKGGYMGGWYRQGVDVNQEVMAVSEDIKAGKSSLDVDYGMSKSAKEKVEQRYDGIKKQAKKNTEKATIDLTDDNALSKLVEGVHGSTRYKIIANYILDVLGKDPITLSDGTVAIVDNRDASHIASNAWDSKTRHIAKIKDLVAQAVPYAYENDVEHNKFDQFLYYQAMVRFDNEEFPLYLHVGRGLNDKKYHIYDITKKIRDTANRINGFERPKPNEGYAPKNDISNKSISHPNEVVKKQLKKDSLGNTLSDEQVEFFKDSKVRDNKGNLLVVYHGTTANFNTFKKGDIGFHFGTKGAARGRVGFGKNVTIKEVYLNVTNPIEFDEDLGSWDADYRLTRELYDKGILTKEEAESVLFSDDKTYRRSTESANKKLSSVLMAKGYDGISYQNTFETKKATTSYIVFNSNQAKEITNTNPTSNPDIRYQKKRDPSTYAPTFYSQMGKVIDDIKMDKIGATSVVNYLKGKGIKHDEIKWSGIEAWLEGKKSVTKAELQEFVAGSQLEIVEESSAKLAPEDIIQDFLDSDASDGYTVHDRLFIEGIADYFYSMDDLLAAYELEEGDKIGHLYSLTDDFGDTVISPTEDIESFAEQLQKSFSEEFGGYTRWSQYKLDGGTNYRELVFKMPNSTYSNNAMRAHWGEDAEGVLAHARIQDMTTTDGKKMLFVEEIQSDWHNEGAKDGYADDSEYARIEKLKAKAEEAFFRLEDYSVEVTGLAGEWETIEKTEKGAKLLREYNEAKAEAVKAGNAFFKKIPDAPFRDTYHEYVLKRLLRMAAEEGYDSLGWTPADIQSQRWSGEYAEGYRIEYDQDIPKFLRKYGKKWGATVGKTKVSTKALSLEEDAEMDFISDVADSSAIDIMRGNKEVWSMDITDSMTESVLYEGQAKFQKKKLSNRTILANTLEGAIDTSTQEGQNELRWLKDYQGKIDLIEKEEAHLAEVNAEIKEISFTKGSDRSKLNELNADKNRTANRINTYDKQLMRLESMKPIKDVLAREKELVRKRTEQKGKEALAKQREREAEKTRILLTKASESRKKGIEGRKKTEMRHKIKDIVSDLNKLLLNPTKDQHVPIGLQLPVAQALAVVNMDTIGAEQHLKRLQDELMKAKTPEKAQEIAKKMEYYQDIGGRIDARLTALKTAYDNIVNSEDPLVANSHDEVISQMIAKVQEDVGSTPIRDMSLSQLEEVYDLFKAVLTTIRNANKSFKGAQKERYDTLASRVMEEIDTLGIKRKPLPRNENGKEKGGLRKGKESFAWNNQKPIYAFEHIGSNTLTGLYKNVRAGEDTWAQDIQEAREFFISACKKYGYNSWDLSETFTFKSTTGKDFEISLDMIMSLYAYSKRGKQAVDHITHGGIVLDDGTGNATSYKISEETLSEIIAKVTSNTELKAFVDEMQEYLSSVMGEKGNEVALELYGIKLFKEKFYFPLKSSPIYMAKSREQDQTKGEVKIKNYGITKETKEGAKNPIILSSFVDVWSNHVNEMSMYHAFVLPMEDFYRVFNYHTPYAEETEAVRGYIQNAYGDSAVSYVDQLLKDLNGGAVSDPREGLAKGLMTKFKKAKTMLSLSVIVQQPTSVVRAMALVDAKYFVGKPSKRKHSETWAEVKKYAPVAIIKEMGYFDTNMGRSATDYITGQEYHGIKDKAKALVKDGNYRDEAFSKLPALADELAWCSIWNAVKREVVHTHPNITPNSEEFLKVVGERFTEVITRTQVYDSTLSRSGWMRSKSGLVNMWTAFLGEPTTSINMFGNAILNIRRGNKKMGAKAIGGIAGAIIFNAALVSLVYAMRDDDEDETFLEKYTSRFSTELLEGFNPLTYIPFIKDVWSITQGYDVERTDMSLISDLWSSFEKVITVLAKDTENMDEKELEEHQKEIGESLWGIVGSISSLTGLPVENVSRDIKGVINLIGTIDKDTTERDTSWSSLGDEVWEDVKDSIPVAGKLPDESKTDKLYDAIINGDDAYRERLESSYDTESKLNSALRKALRDNDPRIKEAAVARNNGNTAEYMRIAKEIIAEGNFSQDNIVAAINAEINALNKGESTTSSDADKEKSIFKMDDYYAALIGRDEATAYSVKEDIIETAIANGKDRDEAEDSFINSFVSHLGEQYEKGELSDYDAQDMLINYGGKSEEDAYSKVQYWAFKQDYPDIDLSESAVTKYYEEIEPYGISISVYYDYSKMSAKCTGTDSNGDGKADSGTKKAEIMKVINSLPLSSAQKDALYFANGWARSTLWQAPWH